MTLIGTAATPRPVRLTRRGAIRRERILEVATAVFLERGYAGASVDAIVRETGGSKTNVYRHFGGKEGLFMAVVEALCSEFLHDMKRLDLQGRSMEEGLGLIARSLLDALMGPRHIAFQRLVIAESGRFPRLAQVWIHAGPQQSRSFIADFIATRQSEGQLRRADPQQAATLFHDMLVFNPLHLALAGLSPDRESLDRHIAEVLWLFLRGFSRRQGE